MLVADYRASFLLELKPSLVALMGWLYITLKAIDLLLHLLTNGFRVVS